MTPSLDTKFGGDGGHGTGNGKSSDLIDITTISDSVEKGGIGSHEFHSHLSVNHSTGGIPQISSSIQWNQIFATLAATLSSAGLGCVFAYTATALPDLRLHQPFGPISSSQEMWIGPLALLGGSFACPIAGLLVDSLGRRKTILVMMPFFVGGWLVIAVAGNMEMMYAGRMITGFCGGSINLAIPVFLTETSDVGIRGALTSCFDLMVTVGILFIYFIGTFASGQLQALACAVPSILCFTLMIFVPESPRFLLQVNQVDEARKALAWFRRSTTEQVETELCQLAESVAGSCDKSSSWSDMVRLPILRRPISIGLALMVVQQCSGILPITAYTVDIFHSAGTDINDNLSANIVGFIQVVATVSSALLVDRCGRRLLLIVSEAFMVISMIGMGSFFYMKNHQNSGESIQPNLSWLPLTCLILFVVAFSIGIGPISWVYMGEILPSQVKGKGSCLITLTSWLLSFFMTLGFTGLMDSVGEACGYWIFGGASLLGLGFIMAFVPETKGKTLDEIQSYFN